MKERSHNQRVSVRELAELLRVSTDNIRRAYRRGELPAIRVKTALRFDLEEVHHVMQRQAEAYRNARPCAADGNAGRAQRPQPPLSQTGALFPGNQL